MRTAPHGDLLAELGRAVVEPAGIGPGQRLADVVAGCSHLIATATTTKGPTMSRKMIDCRAVPNEVGCTLAIAGEPDEVIVAATQHATQVHGHTDTPELAALLRSALVDEVAP